jgi:hypothetical protein
MPPRGHGPPRPAGGRPSARGGGNRGKGPRGRSPTPRRHVPSRSSGRSSGYQGGSSRSYQGGGRATGYRTTRGPRYAPGSAASRQHHKDVYARTHPAKPRYSGPPPPSAQMIQQLYGQLGDIGRQKKTYEADYNRNRAGLHSARGLFLKQLADQYKQRGTDTAADFAARGLSQSGLLTEALANLSKAQAGEQSGYQANFQGQLDSILAKLTSQRSDLSRKKRTLNDRYNQARGDRARILKLMGG